MLKTFYVGVKGIIRVNDKVLLMKKKDQNGKDFWDVPGGRMDDGEAIQDTLMREMSEEVSSMKDYKIGDLVHAYRLERDMKDGHGLMLLFYAIEAKPFDVVVSSEHSEYKWFSRTDLGDIASDPSAYINSGYLEAVRKTLK